MLWFSKHLTEMVWKVSIADKTICIFWNCWIGIVAGKLRSASRWNFNTYFIHYIYTSDIINSRTTVHIKSVINRNLKIMPICNFLIWLPKFYWLSLYWCNVLYTGNFSRILRGRGIISDITHRNKRGVCVCFYKFEQVLLYIVFWSQSRQRWHERSSQLHSFTDGDIISYTTVILTYKDIYYRALVVIHY